MGIYKNERVLMPESGYYLKKNNNKIYVYQYTDYYRNADGLSRNRSTAIGILDSDSKLLIPNDNYYKIDNIAPALSYDSVVNYGYTFLVNHIAEHIGLKNILKNIFPECVNEILAMCSYIISQGTVMNYCEDWMKGQYMYGLSHLITSQKSSDIFFNISFEQRKHFFDEWIKEAVDDEYICYDVTSISSYSSNITEIEWGYNRDGDNLEQINLGMFCGEKTRLPVYYNVYNGSLTDKSNFFL